MPSKQMTEARRALQLKIKSKSVVRNLEKLGDTSIDPTGEKLRNFTRSVTQHCTTQEIPSPELTIKPINRNSCGRESTNEEDASDSIVPDITIFPKYPQFLNESPQYSSLPSLNLFASTMRNLIVAKDDFEKFSQNNPFFSGYIFLPKLKMFVHPVVVPNQFSQLDPFLDLHSLFNNSDRSKKSN